MSIRKSCPAVFLTALTALAALPLHASPFPLTARQLAAGSPHVVVAVVEDARSRWNESHTLIVTDHELRIEERLKGDAPERITLTVPGGTADGETHETSASVFLETRARYLLFLEDLHRPSLTPVTGGWQGAFPESAGGFSETVRAARELTAAVEARPEPADTAWLARTARAAPAGEPGLPAKAWDPASAKFVVRDPATPPIVFNPIPPGSRFHRQDWLQMAYWNVYARGLFQVSEPSPTWAFGNGVFDVAGFPSDAQMLQQFNFLWGNATSFVAWRTVEGHVVEADLAFNPAFEWTLDSAAATRLGGPQLFQDAVLNGLSLAWGYHGLRSPGSLNLSPVSRDSVSNLKAQPYDLATLFAEDTLAVRSTYPGTSLRDGVISSYSTVASPLTPHYVPVTASVTSVQAGKGFTLVNPVKIENTGTVDFANPTVEVYLVPERFSLEGSIFLKRFRLSGTLRPGEARDLALGRVTLPVSVPAGSYYFAFVLRVPQDAYQANNRAWSNHDVKVTVTR